MVIPIPISLSIPIVKELLLGCWNCVSRHASYFKDPAGQLAALRTAQQKLQDAKQDLMQEVRLAEHGGRSKRLAQVDRWCTRVDELTMKAEDVIAEATRDGANSTCFGSGTCLFTGNCFSRYRLGRKIAQTKSKLFAVTAEGSFDNVAERLNVPLPTVRAYEPPVGFKTLLENVLGNLKDEHVGIIGLYGMGGIGKTTLLTQIHEAYVTSSSHDFDHVIWVNVKRNQRLEELQTNIGKKIGFDEEMWEARCIQDRCEDITRELNGKKFVLMLDNLWEQLDLVRVGVPLPTRDNGCKIIFTTRSVEICGHMDAHKKIKLDKLGREKAWELFCKKVGDDNILSNPEIVDLAGEVARKCGGLPLALATVGRAMSFKKTPQEWSHAIASIEKSANEVSGMGDEVLPLLKLSYDSLSSDRLKGCLMHLALKPKDAEYLRAWLGSVWYQDGLLEEDVSSKEKIEDHGYEITGVLLSACLLEVTPGEEDRVKLHDVIHDMLVWVARDCLPEGEKYFVESGYRLREVPRLECWEKARVMSLTNSRIQRIPQIPHRCPNLRGLYLSYNPLGRIAPGFFLQVPHLRVLDLSYNENLTVLPPDIGGLISLEKLDLEATGITELPVEIKNLTMLKVLNINSTERLTLIPRHLVSSLLALQMFMFYSGPSPAVESDRINVLANGNEILIEEVGSLRHLIDATLTIRSVDALERYMCFPNLIIATSSLCIEHLETSSLLEVSLPKIATYVESLGITKCESLVSISLEGEEEGSSASSVPVSRIRDIPRFKKLANVYVDSCQNLKDVTAFAFLPNLEVLRLDYCVRVEEVIVGYDAVSMGTLIPFSKLTRLMLFGLPNLSSISQGALTFPCLKKVYILGCPKLNRLPVHSDRVHGPKIRIMVEEDRWNELQWEGETKSAFIPQYSTFTICLCCGKRTSRMDSLDI